MFINYSIVLLMPSLRSLVNPGVLSTKASFDPINLLNNVDFPTFGLPIIATVYTSSFLYYICYWM